MDIGKTLLLKDLIDAYNALQKACLRMHGDEFKQMYDVTIKLREMIKELEREQE